MGEHGMGRIWRTTRLGIAWLLLTGCSTPLLLPNQARDLRTVDGAYLGSVHGRTPSVYPAKLDANPDDPEYRSSAGVAPRDLACRSTEGLLENVDWERAKECLRKLEKPIVVSYTLKTSVPPVWELEVGEEEEALESSENPIPGCLKETLGVVPVFREIFFVSAKDGSCWSRLLNYDVDHWLGLDWKSRRPHFSLTFTSADALDLERRITRISLSPFLEGSKLKGKIAPEVYCAGCLGEKAYKKWTTLPQDRIEGPAAEIWGK